VGLPSDLLPYRDLGLQFGGNLLGDTLSYALGAFDGVTDGNSTDTNPTPDAGSNDGHKDLEGRVFAQPFLHSAIDAWRGLGFGVGGTWGNEAGSAASTLLPAYRTPGQQVFFTYRTGASPTFADGARHRLAPQFYYYVGPFGLLGEYALSSQEVTRAVTPSLNRSGRIDNRAWQLSGSWFLTGEHETFSSFTSRHSFAPGTSGWGAWELALRYHQLEVDEAAFAGGAASFADPTSAARSARALGVGLNWYLNQNVRWMFDYERTRFAGGAKSGDRPDELALLTRFALAF